MAIAAFLTPVSSCRFQGWRVLTVIPGEDAGLRSPTWVLRFHPFKMTLRAFKLILVEGGQIKALQLRLPWAQRGD